MASYACLGELFPLVPFKCCEVGGGRYGSVLQSCMVKFNVISITWGVRKKPYVTLDGPKTHGYTFSRNEECSL